LEEWPLQKHLSGQRLRHTPANRHKIAKTGTKRKCFELYSNVTYSTQGKLYIISVMSQKNQHVIHRRNILVTGRKTAHLYWLQLRIHRRFYMEYQA